MAENRAQAADQNCNRTGAFREAVCVNASRIYDSCGDKDCLEDLRCFFSGASQGLIDQAVNVRVRKADIITVMLDVETVPFNRGFYSVDLTYFFEVTCDVYTNAAGRPCTVNGLCTFDKKVILYGSEGSVKVFGSDANFGDNDVQETESDNLPRAVCQVADPIVLSSRLCEPCDCPPEPCYCVPQCVSGRFDDNLCGTNGGVAGAGTGDSPEKVMFCTLGIFSIVQIERDVQMLIPVYDFCIPEKECVASTDNPCDLFRRIKFPTEQFFPPRVEELHGDEEPVSGCGCNR